MSRIVVFGGGGFIGSAIRASMDAAVAPTRAEADLADAQSLRRLLRPGDRVINAAGYAIATDRSEDGRARLRRDNVDAVEVLAAECARVGAAQLIHISSVAAMGHRSGSNLDEKAMTEPRTPYGRSKRDAEARLAGYADRVPITILRPTSVFGEGRPLAHLLCRIAALPLVPLPMGGRALIPFTYVGNVVAAVHASIGREACHGRTFIVGDEGSYPLRAIVEGLGRGMGRRRLRVLPVPLTALRLASRAEARLRRGRAPTLDPVRIDTLTRSISYSIDAFRQATGYRPPVDLDEATSRIGRWYRNQR